jgi:hypothetical protein
MEDVVPRDSLSSLPHGAVLRFAHLFCRDYRVPLGLKNMRVLYFTAISFPACRMALYCAFSVFLPRLAGAVGLT